MSEDTTEVEVTRVVRETERALLVEVEGEEVWVPKSVIDDDSEVYSVKSGAGTMVVRRWWAENAGLS